MGNSLEEVIAQIMSELDDATAPIIERMFWIGVNNRELWLDDEIYSANKSFYIINKLIQYFNRMDKDIPVEERKPIMLHICCPGGDVDMANGCIGTIKASKTPVYAVNEGRCYSAAAMIFLACSKRFMFKNSSILFHECSTSDIAGHAEDVDICAKEQTYQNDQMINLIVETSTIPLKEVKKKIKHDWYMHSDEALEKGVCTDIISSLDDILF